jgi:hypothetical protein
MIEASLAPSDVNYVPLVLAQVDMGLAGRIEELAIE